MWQALCGFLIAFICFMFWNVVQPVMVNVLDWLTHTVASIG